MTYEEDPIFSQISSGGAYSCGIEASDGSLSCWGLVAGPLSGNGYKMVAAGAAHACAVASDDSLACWGDDSNGQASPPTGAFGSVSAGTTHSCGLQSDGFLQCWGDHSEGQAPAIKILPESLPTIDVDQPWNQPLQISGGRQQPYPVDYPAGSFPGRTGAAGLDELGYSGATDTRYYLQFQYPHTDTDLVLLFQSTDLPAEARWGLDNVTVTLDWSAKSLVLPFALK